jgi:ABC-type glycerol-3-phosphate transport system permease component
VALLPVVGRGRGGRTRRSLIVIGAILSFGLLMHLFPIYWMLVHSVEGDVQNFSHPLSFWPHPAFLQVYSILLKGLATQLLPLPLSVYVRNSLILAFGTLLTQIPISILAAYAMARLHAPRWARWLFYFVVGTLFIPQEATLIPSYLLLKNFPFPYNTTLPHLDLLNTYWAVILPGMAWGFSVLIFKGWFDTLPVDVLDAARMDGAGELRILWSVVLPISLPVIAYMGYTTFTAVWDAFTWPLIVLTSPNKMPLSVALNAAQQTIAGSPSGPVLNSAMTQGVLGWNGVMAMAVLQSIPVFIAFLLFREQIVRGVKITGFTV